MDAMMIAPSEELRFWRDLTCTRTSGFRRCFRPRKGGRRVYICNILSRGGGRAGEPIPVHTWTDSEDLAVAGMC